MEITHGTIKIDSAKIWAVPGEIGCPTCTKRLPSCPVCMNATVRIFALLLLLSFLTRGYGSYPVRKQPGPVPEEGQLGFQYWLWTDPSIQLNQCLNDNHWAVLKDQVRSDLDHIASLGGGFIRFMWNMQDNLNIKATGEHIKPVLEEQSRNLTEMLRFLDERNMKIILAFVNTPLTRDNWQEGWGADTAGFYSDCMRIVNTVIEACEQSEYAGAVLFYDLQNEIQKPYYDWGAHVYDHCTAPAAKKGFSVGTALHNAGLFKEYMGPSRPLSFVDFHSYPDNPQRDPLPAIELFRELFPDAILCMGEFGAELEREPCNYDENIQLGEVEKRMLVAQQENLAYYGIWSFYDRPGLLKFGVMADHDEPRNMHGLISGHFGLAENSDFELILSGMPRSWSAWPSGGSSMTVESVESASVENIRERYCLTASQGNGPDSYESIERSMRAPVKNAFCRIRLPAGSPSDTIAILSDSFLIPAEAERLYLNCFMDTGPGIRYADMTLIQMDDTGSEISRHSSPALDPSDAGWRNLLHHAGSWSVPIAENGLKARIMIRGLAHPQADKDAVLQMDAVSVAAR
jgi:hypothetical protein